LNFRKKGSFESIIENTEAFRNKVIKSTFSKIIINSIIGKAKKLCDNNKSKDGIKLGNNKTPIKPNTIVVTNWAIEPITVINTP